MSSKATVVCVIVCLLPAVEAGAQTGTPSSGTTPSSARAASKATANFDSLFGQLTTGKGKQVSSARQELTRPLGDPGLSMVKKKAYSAKLGAEFERAMRVKDVLVRINVMIAVRELLDERAQELAAGGLVDGCPAVRLHAARAIERFAQEDLLDRGQQNKLLDSLTAAMAAEKSQPVVTSMLTAMSLLTVDRAVAAMLVELNGRVSVHAATRRLPVTAEREALTRLFRRYVNARLAQKPMPRGTSEQFALVAFRWHCMSARILPGAPIASLQNDHRSMISVCETILNDVVPNLPGAEGAGDLMPTRKVGAEIEKADPRQISQRCLAWEAALEKTGFKKAQLDVPPVKEPTTRPTSDDDRAMDT
jgi:hypothetical protein